VTTDIWITFGIVVGIVVLFIWNRVPVVIVALGTALATALAWGLAEGLSGDTLERVVTVLVVACPHALGLAIPLVIAISTTLSARGGTGNPKGVVYSHGNLVTNIHAMGQALRINHDDVLVGWCPLYHDMGLIGTFLSAVYWRLPLVLLSPMAFLTKPRRWLRAISKYKGTISPAPNFGYALAVKRTKPEDREGLDLSSWRVALNGAEPVTMNTVREFTKTYEPFGFQPTAMFPVYGLAESSLAVSFPDPGTPVKQLVVDREHLAHGRAVEVPEDSPKGISLVCCGKAVPGHSVRVLDERGRDQPPCIVGRVITTGGSMQGYYRKPDLTAKVLGADGWLDTGDLGTLTRKGELRLTGRAKDTIVLLGGENVEPAPIEQKLGESEYIAQAVVLGQDQKYLAALIVPKQDAILGWAKDNNVPIVDYEDLLRQPEVVELIDYEVNELVSAKTGFKSFERIFRFALLPKAFEVDRELSAKQEIKRHAIAEIYSHQIRKLFQG